MTTKKYYYSLELFETALRRPATLLIGGRGVQLLNSILLSAILVRRFGLSMVGTYAIGYVAVAFVPHVLALGLNSHLPRLRKRLSELAYIAATVQLMTVLPLVGLLYMYSRLFTVSSEEASTVFLVTLTGCAIGAFNVGLTLSIVARNVRWALLAPCLETSVLLIGAFNATSGHSLAWYVLWGKTLSVLGIWPRIGHSRVLMSEIAPIMKRGMNYVLLDSLGTLNEQIATAVLGFTASRADLGLYRLCQQTLTAAETPGWSYVQSQYPELTTGEVQCAQRIYKNVIRFALLASVLFLAGSLPISFFVYRIPSLGAMLVVLSPALFCRYIIHVSDQRLRATGRIPSALLLSGFRLMVTGLLICALVPALGVWAAVGINAVLSVGFSYFYRMTAKWKSIGATQELEAATL